MAKIVGDDGLVVAVDKSEKYIQYLEEINKTQKLNIRGILSDFDDLVLNAESLDGMYCRWALAWVPNPKEILEKVLHAMKPGGKVVLHEYYNWMSHQINPEDPYLKKAIGGCFQSFQDSGGDIDIGRHLPTILHDLGYEIEVTRPMSKMARPHDFEWQWPRSFYNVYWPKIKEMGYITEEEMTTAYQRLGEIEKQKSSTLLCPSLVEIIARKA